MEKLTDNEIIKALEVGAEIGSEPEKIVLEFINRQQAEIERLNIRNKTLAAITKNYDWKIAKAKAEAIKEFAEKLKNCFCVSKEYLDIMNIIDNLVEEIVGE